MRRREFIALMGASVALPFAAMAQQAGRTYRIGLLTAEPPRHPVQGGAFDALFDGLRRLGFFEGKNLEVHNRVYGQHPELLTEYVAELIKAKVDVIYASGPARIRAVQQATKTIPILGIAEDMLGCKSACKKDPLFGVIGIQSGPQHRGPKLASVILGSRGWDAGRGDDWEDSPSVF